MNRRQFLGALLSLPLLGSVKRAEASPVEAKDSLARRKAAVRPGVWSNRPCTDSSLSYESLEQTLVALRKQETKGGLI